MSILRLTDRGLGDIEVTVDPIVLTNTETGQSTTGPAGELIETTLPKAFDWTWLLVAGVAGLVIGWWLSEGDRRGGGPT